MFLRKSAHAIENNGVDFRSGARECAKSLEVTVKAVLTSAVLLASGEWFASA